MYYKIKGKRSERDCSFVGYITIANGLHGIHYDNEMNNFYFGERDSERKLTPRGLTCPQANRIPSELKKALFDVADKKRSETIKVCDWSELT